MCIDVTMVGAHPGMSLDRLTCLDQPYHCLHQYMYNAVSEGSNHCFQIIVTLQELVRYVYLLYAFCRQRYYYVNSHTKIHAIFMPTDMQTDFFSCTVIGWT